MPSSPLATALIRVLKALKDLAGANEDQTVGIRLLDEVEHGHGGGGMGGMGL